MTYDDAMTAIDSFNAPQVIEHRQSVMGQDWGLETTRSLLDRLGNPQRRYRVLHVAGTKGKGSTCAMLDSICRAGGLRVGLFTSPHLQEFRERIRIDGLMIAPEMLADCVEQALPYARGIEGINRFEFITALALLAFAKAAVDVAVIEVGVGGRLDATNVVTPLVAGIANISLEHTRILGGTVGAIAAEKAGIIKAGAPVVTAPQLPEAAEMIAVRAAACASPLIRLGLDWTFEIESATLDGTRFHVQGPGGFHGRYDLALPGLFQVENACLALAMIQLARERGLALPEAACYEGLRDVRWPARMEVLGRHPLLIADGAHNARSMERLVESLQTLAGVEGVARFHIIFGCLQDKDRRGMLGVLLPFADRLILCPVLSSHRSTPVAEILAQIEEVDGSARARVDAASSLPEALAVAYQHSEDAVICITGSLSLAAEARALRSRRALTID